MGEIRKLLLVLALCSLVFVPGFGGPVSGRTKTELSSTDRVFTLGVAHSMISGNFLLHLKGNETWIDSMVVYSRDDDSTFVIRVNGEEWVPVRDQRGDTFFPGKTLGHGIPAHKCEIMVSTTRAVDAGSVQHPVSANGFEAVVGVYVWRTSEPENDEIGISYSLLPTDYEFWISRIPLVVTILIASVAVVLVIPIAFGIVLVGLKHPRSFSRSVQGEKLN